MFPEDEGYTPEENARCAVRYGFVTCWPHYPDGPATVTPSAFPVSGDTIAKMTREKR